MSCHSYLDVLSVFKMTSPHAVTCRTLVMLGGIPRPITWLYAPKTKSPGQPILFLYPVRRYMSHARLKCYVCSTYLWEWIKRWHCSKSSHSHQIYSVFVYFYFYIITMCFPLVFSLRNNQKSQGEGNVWTLGRVRDSFNDYQPSITLCDHRRAFPSVHHWAPRKQTLQKCWLCSDLHE